MEALPEYGVSDAPTTSDEIDGREAYMHSHSRHMLQGI
jgi:hypothetical protein